MTCSGYTNYSRIMRLAAGSAGRSETDLEERIQNSNVVVTADPDAPGARATLGVLVANLRRLPLQLQVASAPGDRPLPSTMVAEIEALAHGIDPERGLTIGRPTSATIHVHVGAGATDALVSGMADGHGTRIRPRGYSYPASIERGTGLGAVLTAAMLSAEVFKTVVGVAPNRHGRLRPINFCPVSLDAPTGGPPRQLPILRDVALVGCGAIGTAIALILRELEADGSLIVVDPQTFDDPNVTTYSLGTRDDAGKQIRKVDLIQRELPRLAVTPVWGTARDLIDRIESGRVAMPSIVLGAVDSIDARHEIAALHAEQTLDGSTGGVTGTMLSLAEATWKGPCLRCYYPARSAPGPTVEQQIAQQTGLAPERLARGQEPLTAEEVAALGPLPKQVRQRLIENIDKPVCGLGRTLGLVGNDDDYRPSASFVAQQSAALVVGALLRGGTAGPSKSVQYDALFGPMIDVALPRVADPRCRCQNDSEIISSTRSRRQRGRSEEGQPS